MPSLRAGLRICRAVALAGAIAFLAWPVLAVEAGTAPDEPEALPMEAESVAPGVPAGVTEPAEAAKPAEDGSKVEPVGAGTCLACHPASGSFRGNIHAKAWPKVKGIGFEASCETCHGYGSLHAAAAGDRSVPGFKTIRNPRAEGTREGSGTCLSCHKGGKQLHWEGSVHETRAVGCADCHAVHGGHGKNLRGTDVKETCLRCYQNLKAEIRRRSHHPIIEGRVTCSDCHNPHGTPGPKFLVGNGVKDTCFKCHADKRGPFLWEHRPVSEDCTVCHVPHGSVHDRLLRQKSPYLCQSCHSGSRHPGTPYAANPNTPGRATFERLRVQAYYRGCLNCHPNIHGSNHPAGNYFLR